MAADHRVDDHVGADFTSFETLLHPSDPEDLVNDLDMGCVLQAPLGVTSNILKLIGSNAVRAELADNVKQELNAFCWK